MLIIGLAFADEREPTSLFKGLRIRVFIAKHLADCVKTRVLHEVKKVGITAVCFHSVLRLLLYINTKSVYLDI